MRIRLLAAGAVLALIASLANGCSKSTTAPASVAGDQQSQVSATLTAAASLVDENLAEDPSLVTASASYAPSGSASALAVVHPFTWWRHITSETRSWDFAWADTDSTGKPKTCVATLHKHLVGEFVIAPASQIDSTQADSTQLIRKTLDETVTRKVMLRRLNLSGSDQWKVVALTAAFVTTPGATTSIQSLRIRSSSGVDTTLTDPLQWHSLPRVLKFGTSDTVTVTVTTLRSDDAVYIHRSDWRHRLRNDGGGTYSFSWVTTSWSGWRHFGIQAMSHGSLYDDTHPYDSQAWHLPFRVVGGQPDVTYYP